MSTAFDGTVPTNYDRFLVPMLFEPYARDLVQRLLRVLPNPTSVLEIAAGTGVVTRHLRDHLPTESRLVASDLKPGMLAKAREKFSATDSVEWREADASALPFASNEFDAVVCQFGIMFLPDKEVAMRETLRVLRPGGFFLFNTWSSLAENPATRVTHETLLQIYRSDPPLFYEKTPFGYHDAGATEQNLRNAGFGEIRHEVVSFPSRSASAVDAASGLVLGTPIFPAIKERSDPRVDEAVSAVAEALRRAIGDEPFETVMSAQVWQARKPR